MIDDVIDLLNVSDLTLARARRFSWRGRAGEVDWLMIDDMIDLLNVSALTLVRARRFS